MISSSITMKSTGPSAQKPKRNHLDEFLPLYKKFGESNADCHKRHKSSEKHDDLSKLRSDSPKHQLSPRKHPRKQAVEHKIIENVSENLSTSKSQKRSKSVSVLLEETDQAVVKKSKSDDAQEGATGDTPQKVQKHKKNKKSEKENKAGRDQTHVDEAAILKKEKNNKNIAGKSSTEDTPIDLINETNHGDSVGVDKKIKKKSKKINTEITESELNQTTEKTKKAKKQKHQDQNNYEGEPVSKSPKTAFIDNLENLNLKDNTHSLANFIDEMTVVDKAKQKKLRKMANREKILLQNETEKNHMVGDKTQHESGDSDNEEQAEKKKWAVKRWNKRQIAERNQKTTINVDNLPVSLLKHNFKKILIDHFSKYGLSRSVGEPYIQNEEGINPVFSTKVYFNTAEATAEALEMDGSSLTGNEIRVSPMRPLTETVLVIRIYGHPDKLKSKDIRAAFHDAGLIRSIRPMLRKKKTMATAFVEFDGPEAVRRALQKSAGLTINGKQVLASLFTIRSNEKKKKRKRGGKKKGAKGSKKVPVENTHDEDSSDDSDDSDDE